MIGAGAALVVIIVVALLVHRARRRGHAALVAATNGGGVVGGMSEPAPVLAVPSSTVRLASFPTVTEEGPSSASPPANGNGNGNGHSTLDGHSTGHAGTDLSAELARPITDGAPGWRHDPDGRPDHIRYFDGRSWTDFYARKIVVLELAASS